MVTPSRHWALKILLIAYLEANMPITPHKELWTRLGSFLLLSLLATVVLGARATDQATLSGRVADANGNALSGALVQIEPRGVSAVTDNDGKFVVAGLRPGAYSVAVSFVGFVSVTKDLDLA